MTLSEKALEFIEAQEDFDRAFHRRVDALRALKEALPATVERAECAIVTPKGLVVRTEWGKELQIIHPLPDTPPVA